MHCNRGDVYGYDQMGIVPRDNFYCNVQIRIVIGRMFAVTIKCAMYSGGV